MAAEPGIWGVMLATAMAGSFWQVHSHQFIPVGTTWIIIYLWIPPAPSTGWILITTECGPLTKAFTSGTTPTREGSFSAMAVSGCLGLLPVERKRIPERRTRRSYKIVTEIRSRSLM